VTPTTALTLHYGDGEYLFDLKLPQLAELQEKCGAGVFKVYSRVLRGRYLLEGETVALTGEGEAFVEDLFETIRLGLIGGGRGIVNGKEVPVSAMTAKLLVERYSHPAPLRESWATAAAILGARIEGYVPPKKKAPPVKPRATRTRKSTSRRSSPTAASSEPTGGN
jgi:hypothetical protein